MAKRKVFSAEQIIMKLREAEVLLGHTPYGAQVARMSRKPVVCLRSASKPTTAGEKNMGV